MTGRRRKPGRMGPFIEGYGAWLAGRAIPRARSSTCWRWPGVWAGGWTPAVLPFVIWTVPRSRSSAMRCGQPGCGVFRALGAWIFCWSTWKVRAFSRGLPRLRHRRGYWLSSTAGGW